MKAILIFTLVSLMIPFTCSRNTDRGYSDTGTGWTQQRTKVQFKDSLNFMKKFKINDTTITTSASRYNYLNTLTDNIQTQINSKVNVADSIQGSTLYPELADTIPLFTFGAGGGLISDTACFNDNALAGSFYNEGSDTLVVTQLMGILKEGTGTETISVQISWHSTMLSGSATSLNASPLAITSLTTGTEDTSFANYKIPPNVFVWCILSGASKDNKPTFLSVTLSGHKKPRY